MTESAYAGATSTLCPIQRRHGGASIRAGILTSRWNPQRVPYLPRRAAASKLAFAHAMDRQERPHRPRGGYTRPAYAPLQPSNTATGWQARTRTAPALSEIGDPSPQPSPPQTGAREW